MFKKLGLELLIVLGIIVLIWFFFKWWNLNEEIKNPFELAVEKEEQLGRFLLENYEKVIPIIEKAKVKQIIEKIRKRLTDELEFSEYNYKIIVVNNPNINAFAFPGGYILVFSGLLNFADSAEEVAAVLAHEIGHIENKHVVKKLVKAVGLQTIKVVLSGGDSVVLTEVGETIISSFFDRHQEKEADKFALDLLVETNIDPRIIATFFRRLKNKYKSKIQDISEKLEIINTHPNITSRIQESLSHKLPSYFKEEKIKINWKKFKKELK